MGTQGVIRSLQKIASISESIEAADRVQANIGRPADAMIKGETLLTKIKEKIMHAACMLLVCIILLLQLQARLILV